MPKYECAADLMPEKALVADLPLIKEVMNHPVMLEIGQQVVNYARVAKLDNDNLKAGGDGIDELNYTVIRGRIMDILGNCLFIDELIKD